MTHVDDSTGADWRATAAMYKRAMSLEETGADAALPLYREVVKRLDGAAEPKPREMLICAMNDVALLQEDRGRSAEARKSAEALIRDHFDDPPSPDAGQAVVSAGMLLLRLLSDASEWQAAADLSDRLIARYGQVEGERGRWTTVMAGARGAWLHARLERYEEAVRRYDAVLHVIGQPVDPEFTGVFVGSLAGKAQALDQLGKYRERDAICARITRQFADSDDPEVAEHLAWAQLVLDEYSLPRLREWRPQRRPK